MGETAIRASFQTEVGVTIVTVPYTHEIASERFKPLNNFIDDAAYRKLAQLRIEPAELSNDEELPDIPALLTALKSALGDKVSDVRATGRLSDSAVVLGATTVTASGPPAAGTPVRGSMR